MLTNRCSLPLSTRRSDIPEELDSRSLIPAWRVSPLAETRFSPPVWVRRMVGIDTEIDMVRHSFQALVLLDDLDGLFGDDAVQDAIAAQLVLVGVAGRYQHVVGVGLGRI